MEDYLKTKQGE